MKGFEVGNVMGKHYEYYLQIDAIYGHPGLLEECMCKTPCARTKLSIKFIPA